MTTPPSDTLLLSQATGLDPQTLRELAKHLSRQLETQSIDFAPALQSIDFSQDLQTIPAFYPGGLYNRRDPETGERLPGPDWGDMTRGSGMGGMLGGMLEGMTRNMDAFLQFFKDLAAAATEALNSLRDLGAAISAFAELAAGAAESIAGLLQARVKSKEDETPPIQLPGRIGEDFDVAAQRFLAGGQPPPPQLPTPPPLLENAATWVGIIVEKFEPILREIRILVGLCAAELVNMQIALTLLPGLMPKQEEKGFLGELSSAILSILSVLVGGVVGKLIKVAVAIAWSIVVMIVSFFLKMVDEAIHVATSDQSNNTKEDDAIHASNKHNPEYKLTSTTNTYSDPDFYKKFEWPGAMSLSTLTPFLANTGTTNNYYNCNNSQPLTINAPTQASTPDALAESIIRELKTLGMGYDYAIRG